MVLLNGGVITEQIKPIRDRAERLLEAERLFLGQKAKIEFLKNSDKCTKFFYDLIKRNNKKNVILAINKSDGSSTTIEAEIAKEFLCYFKQLLVTKVDRIELDHEAFSNGPKLSDEQQKILTLPITISEIKKALFDIDKDKAPCHIMECITSTSYSISINGQLHGMFKGERGLRQGDPLSFLLFAISLEVFSRSLKQVASSSQFKFHSKCDRLQITHLAYVDDLLFFSRGDVGSVTMLMDCLNKFGRMAGLSANVQKSNIYMAGIDNRTKQDILQITRFQEGGFPFRKIMWSSNHPPISWTMLCAPKEGGGLGLKDLKAWNKALLAKTLWNIHANKDSLWIKWVNQFYLKCTSVWDWKSKRDDSPLIKKLIAIRDEIFVGLGSVEVIEGLMKGWFTNKNGISEAYNFFCLNKLIWHWKPPI